MAASQNEAHPTKGNIDDAQPTLPPPGYSVACAAFHAHPNPDEAILHPPHPPIPPSAFQAAPQPPGQPYYVQQPGISYGNPMAAPYYGYAESQSAGVGAYPATAAGGTLVIASGGSNVSMVGAMALSCIVFWCFFGVFGGIAFILALVGQNANTFGDTRRAIQWRKASYGVSAVGIVVGVVVIGIIIGVSTSSSQSSYYYRPYYSYSNSYYRPSYYSPYRYRTDYKG